MFEDGFYVVGLELFRFRNGGGGGHGYYMKIFFLSLFSLCDDQNDWNYN